MPYQFGIVVLNLMISDFIFFVIDQANETGWLSSLLNLLALDLDVDKAILLVLKVSFSSVLITQFWMSSSLTTVLGS